MKKVLLSLALFVSASSLAMEPKESVDPITSDLITKKSEEPVAPGIVVTDLKGDVVIGISRRMKLSPLRVVDFVKEHSKETRAGLFGLLSAAAWYRFGK